MLELSAIETGYGETKVIHGLDLQVRRGTVHALLGRNGVGKSTTLKAIIGHLPLFAGSIALEGSRLSGAKPYAIARVGVAYVPETRDIFGALSVHENLKLAGRLARGRGDWTFERVVDLFPNLKERLGSGGHQLSGGEQQMLAIARALIACPKIVLLDEPTEGLAPIVIQRIFRTLKALKTGGLTFLLVEQNLNFALGLADEVTVLSRGKAVWRGAPEALGADRDLQARWLGV